MASHKSHFRHAKKYKENRAICTRDFSSVSPAVWSVIVPSWSPAGGVWNLSLNDSRSDSILAPVPQTLAWMINLNCKTAQLDVDDYRRLTFFTLVTLDLWILRLIGSVLPRTLEIHGFKRIHWWLPLMTIDERITRGTRLPNLTWKQPRRNLHKVYIEL